MATRLREARAQGLLDGHPAVVVHDLGRMLARWRAVGEALGPGNHALAVKANPVVGVLRAAVQAGAGLEAASMEELHLARVAGCPPARIVYDAPAKTPDELRLALSLGVHLNADSLGELARIDALRREGLRGGTVGLRVNPQVGKGAIAATSVGGHGSRFGVPIGRRDEILDAYARYPWLTGVHSHVGSQGTSMGQLFTAARRVRLLIEEIEERVGGRRIEQVDLGGGLPARYREQDHPPTLEELGEALRAASQGVFEGRQLITEFGRTIQASSGYALSRVEYVRTLGDGSRMAVLHLGADFMMRTAYRGEDWPHEFAVLDPELRLKQGPLEAIDLAGPLCFQGDKVGLGRALPPIAPGDHVLYRDVGAYTLGAWSRHCSRALPRVLGVDAEGRWSVLKERESLEDVARFWGG
ncbi:MAG: diaminopimelate decarboxylase [Alphaproteobacteria bacterium]|nr:diaminopimelate decarboxylase [Alphaproteobacteria bacterium]MCB9795094.1 diaminopimelate decarboxylase [Alphaproteobacteria bacterium]